MTTDRYKTSFSLTSPTAFDRMWTIFSWGVATTLWLLISMMRCPTLTPPRSAMPPRIRLQICRGGGDTSGQIPRAEFYRREKSATHDAILDAKAQLVAQVGSPDEDRGHGGAPDDVQLDPRLVLQSLQEANDQSQSGGNTTTINWGGFRCRRTRQ